MLRLLLVSLVLLANALAEPVNIAAGIQNAMQPHLAVHRAGTVHAVFGAANTIYHTSSLDGRTFRSPVKIAELPKLALGRRRGPRVVATSSGLIVSAISHSTGTLHAWTSRDDGKTWAATESLNTVPNSAREGLHAMASDGDAVAVATWLDLRNGKTELWSRLSKDGGISWEPEVRVYASPDGTICQCCHPSVAIGPKGEIAALWRNAFAGARDMWMAVSTDGGKTFPNPQKLGHGTWKLDGCPMDGGGIAFDFEGQPVTVWRRESTVYQSAPATPETKIATSGTQPVIASRGQSFDFAFEQHGKVVFARSGQPLRFISNGRMPALVSSPKMTWLAWEADNGVFVAPHP